MYNKKVLIESLKKLGNAKAPTQKKDIILNSVRGQWDNPGDITQVPGASITMGPDPLTGKPLTKPLLGVGSNGQRQMMYPGKDYDFGNAEYVTEYPMGSEKQSFKKGGGPGDRWLASLVKQATRSNNLLTYPVKLAGERIARQSATASRTKQQILDAFFDKNYASKLKYFGNANIFHSDPTYGYGKRDLIANYFRGIDTGFEPIDYDFDSDAGLEALINEYGPLKAYLMNSEIQHGEPLIARDLMHHRLDKSAPYHGGFDDNMQIRDPNISKNWAYSNFSYDADETKENFHKLFDLYGKETIPFDIQYDTSKPPPLFNFDYSPVNPIDDVGGHMGFLQRTPQNEFQLTTRDSWGFVPESYNPKWNIRKKFKQRQVQLMDAFGKPFILTQTNPIIFKKGGVHKTKNKNSRSYSRSLDATNKFFAENYLFEKPSSRKNKIYDPHAKYYQEGGASSPEKWEQEIRGIEGQIGNPTDWTMNDYYSLQDKLNAYRDWRENTPEGQAVIDSHNEEGEYNIPLPEHLQDYTNAMMKSKLAYANEFGNPAAKRMINLPDNPYQFDNGDTGTHYMASMDNYAVPQIQDENGQLVLGDYDPSSREAMRFDSDEDARYFAEHYKDVAPGFINAKLTSNEIEEYAKGGYIIEDISVPELDKAQKGKTVQPYYTSDPKEYAFRKAAYDDSLYMYKNNLNPLPKSTIQNMSYEKVKGIAPYRSYEHTITGKNNINNSRYHNNVYQDDSPYYRAYYAANNKFLPQNNPIKIDARTDYYAPYSIENPFTGKLTGLFLPGQTEQKDAYKRKYAYARYKKPVQPVNYIQSVKPIDKKPVNKKPVQSVQPVKPVEEVTPLKPIPYQQSIRPEYEIIPAPLYKKPIRYSGPRYGVLAGDENLNLPEGYTQEQREAARRKRDSDVFQRKNLEYQQQQRGTQPIVTRKYGGILDKAQNGLEQTATDTDKDYYTRMANSPLFKERYARMVGKPIDQVGEEAEAYRQQILNNIETVKINDVGVYPDKVTKRRQSKSIEGVYHPPFENEEWIEHVQKNINEAPEFRKKHLQKNFDKTLNKLQSHDHNLFLYDDNPWTRTHELSHASVKGDINDKNVNAYPFRNLSDYPALDKYYNSDTKYLKYFDSRKEYLTSPDEQKARIDVARKYLESKGLYDPVNEPFTEKHYYDYIREQLKPNNDVPHDLEEISIPYDKETTIKMFNDFVEKEPNQNSNLVKAEQGGEMEYELGDEIDEATKRKLEKLGYTFEII